MADKCHVLRSGLISLLLSSIAVGTASSTEKPEPADQTLEAIQNWMVQAPAPWPDEWMNEFIDTIRS